MDVLALIAQISFLGGGIAILHPFDFEKFVNLMSCVYEINKNNAAA
jgi:hypothetical protein